MSRWLRLLTPFALVILVGHLGYNGFRVYDLLSQMAEERLRAGMESLLTETAAAGGGAASGAVERRVFAPTDIPVGDIGSEGRAEAVRKGAQGLVRDRTAGRSSSRAFREGDRVILLRWAGSTPSAAAAFALLENRSALSSDLFEKLAALDRDLAKASERALYRLTAVSDPTRVFEDEAYRHSVSRCEDLLRELDEAIESAEGDALPPEVAEPLRKRRELRLAIERERSKLRAIHLSDTELRLPILKQIRAKEREMAALPAPRPTATGEALRGFVWMRVAESLAAERLVPPDDALLKSQVELRRWAFSAGGGSRVVAHRRALEVFMTVHRTGLVASAAEVMHADTAQVELLSASGVPEKDSPLLARLKLRAAIFLGLAGGDLVIALLWLFFTRGLRRSIRGVAL